MNKANNLKRKIDVPLCKYGSGCYQKNPEHRNKFAHPNEEKKDQNNGMKRKHAEEYVPRAVIKKEESISMKQNEPTLSKDTVKSVLATMPKDFFEFWKFSSSVNKSNPEDAFIKLGMKLVGTYDLLMKNLDEDQEINLDCHYRYYYDPPEFQTVVIFSGEEQYHIGYFRDDPSQFPSILASNNVSQGSKLTLRGDNIFAAVSAELKERIPKLKNKIEKDKFLMIHEKLKKYAGDKKFSLELQSAKTKERSKMVVAKTFHGLGIVVPVVNDIGYRPLPDSDAVVKKILKKITDAKTENDRLIQEEALDEITTNVNLANDEFDFGMGLELGIDLFCNGDPFFHKKVVHLLTLAYTLLKRPKYANVIAEHLKDRRKTDVVNVFDSS